MMKLLVFVVPFILSACVSFNLEEMQRQWQSQNCNEEAAYSKGFNDAREGEKMNSQYAGQCPGSRQSEVRVGYGRGFKAGLDSMRKEQPFISVNIGGTTTASNGQGNGQGNGWFCEMSMFGKNYRAFAGTRLEAQEKIMDQCAIDGNEFHCRHRDADCRINR